MCFGIYLIVYSSYSNFVAAHDVDIHTWARDYSLAAGTQKLIVIGVCSLKGVITEYSKQAYMSDRVWPDDGRDSFRVVTRKERLEL